MAEQAGGMDGTLQKARYTSRWRRSREGRGERYYLTVADGGSGAGEGDCKFERALRSRSALPPAAERPQCT